MALFFFAKQKQDSFADLYHTLPRDMMHTIFYFPTELRQCSTVAMIELFIVVCEKMLLQMKVRRRNTWLWLLSYLLVPFLSMLWKKEWMKCISMENDDQHQYNDAMMLQYMLEDNVSSVHFTQFFGSSFTLEAFLRFCLGLAILLFLYYAALLQHTLMMLGLRCCERHIDTWSRVVNLNYQRLWSKVMCYLHPTRFFTATYCHNIHLSL
jgi:hypothetical protein